jgi:Tfp pilus assembly protein PilF
MSDPTSPDSKRRGDDEGSGYLFHIQKPPAADASRASGLRQGDRAFEETISRHIRVAVIVVAAMAAFLTLAIYIPIKVWNMKNEAKVGNMPPMEQFDKPRSKGSVLPPGTGALPSNFGNNAPNADTVHQAMLMARNGDTYFAASNYEAAVETYSQALTIHPGLASVQSKLGMAHLTLGNYARAQLAFERAVEKDPSSVVSLNALGVTYLRQQRMNKASESFSSALNMEPNYPPALFNLALCMRLGGNLPKAAELIERYLQARPDDPRGLRETAVLAAAQGNYEEALKTLKRAILRDPSWGALYLDAAASTALMGRGEDAINYLRDAEKVSSPVAVYLVYQQPAFKDVRVTEAGKVYQKELVERAQKSPDASRARDMLQSLDPMLGEMPRS